MHSQDFWNVAGEKPCKRPRDGKLVAIRFSRRFEPHRSTTGFDSHEAERRTAVQLLESACHPKSQRANVVLNPLEQFFDPAGSAERSRGGFRGVPFHFLERALNDCAIMTFESALSEGHSGEHPVRASRRFRS